jgi:hypothetical protein
MLPHWTAKKIGIRIKNKSLKNKRSNEEGNPIKVRFFFWFMNEVVIVLWFSSGKKYYLQKKLLHPFIIVPSHLTATQQQHYAMFNPICYENVGEK